MISFRLFLVLLSLLWGLVPGVALSNNAHDYRDFPHLRSTQTEQPATKVEVDGFRVYALRPNGVSIVDISDLDHPQTVATYPVDGLDLAYWQSQQLLVVGTATGLEFVDVSNPATPTFVREIPRPSRMKVVLNLTYTGTEAFFVEQANGQLYSFRLTNPTANPTDEKTGGWSTTVRDVAGNEQGVYLGTDVGLVHAQPGATTYTMTVVDSADVLDLSLNDSGTQLSSARGPNGGVVYSVAGDGSLTVTFSTGSDPVTVTRSEDDGSVYFGNGVTLTLHDVGDPQNPVVLFDILNPDPHQFDTGGSILVSASDAGLRVVDLANRSRVESLREISLILPKYILTDRNQPGIVFLISGYVQAMDFTNIQSHAVLDVFTVSPQTLDATVEGGRAYVTSAAGGLEVVDVSNPSSLQLHTSLPGSFDSVAPDPNGQFAILGDNLSIYYADISDPQNPALRGAMTFDGTVLDMKVVGDRVVVSHANAIEVVDLSDPDLLNSQARYEQYAGIDRLTAAPNGDVIFVDGAEIPRVDPDTGQVVTNLDIRLDGPAGDFITIEGDIQKAGSLLLYLLEPAGTMYIVDWTDPLDPLVVGEATRSDFAPQRLAVTDGAVFVSSGVGFGQIVILPAQETVGPTSTGTVGPPVRTIIRSIYPNPMAASSNILLEIPRASDATVDVFDIRGRRVRSLFRGTVAAGSQLLRWDGRDDLGSSVAAGQYFVRARTQDTTSTRRVVLLQ